MHSLRNPMGGVKSGMPVLFALGVGLSRTVPAGATGTTYTDNVTVPISVVVFVPRADGGSGELVYLGGSLHVLFHIAVDDTGGFHAKTHFQPQGVSGTGLVTGDKYQGTGVTQDQFNGKLGSEVTYVNNFRIIGQGPDNNLLLHETFHTTVNAKGEVTVVADNFSTECY